MDIREAFAQPKPVADVDMAFGGIDGLLPEFNALPDEHRRGRGASCRLVSDWFFEGLKGADFIAKPGVDERVALRHLGTIMRSFQPAHEHKTAAVAWLLEQWFLKVVGADGKTLWEAAGG